MKKQEIDQYLYLVQEMEQSKCLLEVELMINEISFDDAKKYISNMKIGENILKKYGIALESIKSFGKEMGQKLDKMFDKGMTKEEASEEIKKDMTVFVMKKSDEVFKRINDLDLGSKVIMSIVMVMIAGIVNSTMGTIFLFMAPRIAQQLVAIVVAPMVEEAIKQYFIKQGYPWVGTGVAFGIEFLQYVFGMIASGINIGKALILRVAALLMHFGTTYVQKKIIDSSENKYDRRDKEKIAWVTGVLMHATWNTLAVIYGEKIGNWALNK
jgi:hypothetical protein